jgi:hypothetical protein
LAAVTLRFTYLALLRLLGWIALFAWSDLAKGAEILIPAPPDRRAPASRQSTQADLGRPGDPVRADLLGLEYSIWRGLRTAIIAG